MRKGSIVQIGGAILSIFLLATGCSNGKEQATTTSSTSTTLQAPTSSTYNTTTILPETTVRNTTTTAPPAGSVDCGLVAYKGIEVRVVIVKGASCNEAKVVVAAESSNDIVPDWICTTGRADSSYLLTCNNENTKVFILRPSNAPLS